ncbi:hypothetical protein KC901_00205 [Patescibacteria group bacterium]|nr:hypothetical protein [Patescibacteria group bacterium]
MEPNNEQSNFIRERESSSKSLWYIIIVVLVLALIGWYGYSAGWFSPRETSLDEFLPADLNNEGLPANAAPIDSIHIETTESFPIQETVVVAGNLPNGCTYLNTPTQFRDGNVFYITLDTYTEGDVCTEALVPYEERIPLQVNNLPQGVYVVNVNGQELSFELESDNAIDFTAGEDK